MNDKQNGDDSLKPQQIPSAGIEPKREIAETRGRPGRYEAFRANGH